MGLHCLHWPIWPKAWDKYEKAVFFEVYCTYATFLFLVVSDVETEYYSKDVNYYQEQQQWTNDQ